ncbi:MAG: tRNA pseudouridine(55) synthase TruB [Tissierellia bacterium]|nr:tRNA pseudouridine(55) synthase TruB [Tissierellia bacterium]
MNGILLFNKPQGISSHDAVYILRRKTKIKKIGHTGTLDPMATGVLPMCIGKATKVSDYILKGDKEYIAQIRLGIQTDTYDITGTVTNTCTKIVSRQNVLNVLQQFIGVNHQVPPMYSAIKVGGKKLYEYAREGITIQRKSREIHIFSIELLDFSKNTFTIKVNCSSGTYIRSLANDIGLSLGTYATLSKLIRSKTSDFMLKDCITEKELECMDLKELEKRLIPLDRPLRHLKPFDIPSSGYKIIINGGFYPLKEPIKKGYYRLYCDESFLGIGETREINKQLFIKMNKKLI